MLSLCLLAHYSGKFIYNSIAKSFEKEEEDERGQEMENKWERLVPEEKRLLRTHSDDSAPLVANDPNSSTQDGTCHSQTGKLSSSVPSQSKRRSREEEEIETEELQSAVVTSRRSSCQSTCSESSESQGLSLPEESQSADEEISWECSSESSQGSSLSDEESQSESRDSEHYKILEEQLENKYEQLHILGEGAFGSVFAGLRRYDGLPVAVKYIPIDDVKFKTVTQNEQRTKLPLEVLLMRRMNDLVGSTYWNPQASVALLDVYMLRYEVVLVLERPVPSMDLSNYIKHKGGRLCEEEAKEILKQLVEAAITIHAKGIFHRDIKPENILVQTNPEGLKIWVLDFGSGCFMSKETFTKFRGTDPPPEWHVDREYRAEPSTMWEIGIVLYIMLQGKRPFSKFKHIATKNPFIPKRLSQECADVLRRCLTKDPNLRPTLTMLQEHPWLTCS